MNAVIADFIDAMDRAGVSPAEPIAHLLGDGEIVRFQAEGDRKGRKNGWALLHLEGVPAGAFGSFRMGFKSTWSADTGERLDPAERAALALRRRIETARRRDLLHARQREVAAQCAERWDRGVPADPAHPYLVAKRVSADGLRQDGRALLVPMLDAEGALWNLQAIYPGGSKFFAKGGRQEGLHYFIGEPVNTLVVGEGFSTCAAVRRATGLPVVVAFSSANLCRVALSVRDRWPNAEIIIAADDDAHLVDRPHINKNLGLEAAKDAARAVGGRVAMPPRGEAK